MSCISSSWSRTVIVLSYCDKLDLNLMLNALPSFGLVNAVIHFVLSRVWGGGKVSTAAQVFGWHKHKVNNAILRNTCVGCVLCVVYTTS